ncbi:MAG: histidine phosphatase family protein [Iamia sp.]
MGTTRLLLVRHGVTEWSASRRHTGRTDVPLTPEGEDQARALADTLPLDGLAAVWASPLVRAQETARLAGLRIDGTDPDLAEWDYGAIEGRTTAEIREEGDPRWTVWDGPVEGGESVASVGSRVDRVLERTREVDGTVVLVAHAHLLRILAARWLGLPAVAGRHLTLDAGGWALLGWERETPVIERWNPPPV